MPAKKPPLAPVEETGAEVTTSEVTSLSMLEAALEADQREIVRVSVPEWDGKPTFWLRALSGTDRDAIENAVDVDNLSAMIVVRALVKPDGTQLVPPARRREFERLLGARTAGGLLRLQRVVKKISKLNIAAMAELEAILKDVPSAEPGSD